MITEDKTKSLRDRGVSIPAPSSVEIGDEVQIDRISGEGVTIHGGCRIFGKTTFISKGCIIGREGPVTLDSCQLGPDVKINGGFVKSSVFLNGVTVGYGAHIREGSILEEEASVAHTVGLKQTILFPFVTLGSLINFCDCFMAGGTSRKNHSEVGSSYIHFNYTPNQDKATASLLGDVPRGVMLNNKPIFLGGQGGMVGPCRLNYGTVIAAGTIQRKDELEPDRLLFGGALRPGNIKHTPGIFQNIPKVVGNNLYYIANQIALMNWYKHVRTRFVSDSFPLPVLQGLFETLALSMGERIKRLKEFLEKASAVRDSAGHEPLTKNWNRLENDFKGLMSDDSSIGEEKRDAFLKSFDSFLNQTVVENYIDAIKSLDMETASAGTAWLSDIVDDVYQNAIQLIPGIKS
ncbi:MAG: protein GlmU [Desulfobacteraceae bacterium]|jgi:UDP-N-acetylglucosamine/UDP-N-acetylgalactosamine diphosphorylase